MNNSYQQGTTSSLKWWHIVLIIIVCTGLWFLGVWGVHCIAEKFPNDNLSNAGLIGDSAGAINALFSALAFCGVVIAIILQKRELEFQRDELKATNEQLEAQKEEFKTQNETLKRQRFENTFFQMMSLQQEIVNNLSFSYDERQETKTLDGNRSDNRGSMSLLLGRNEEIGYNTKTSTTTITRTLKGRDVFSKMFEEAGQTYIEEKDLIVKEVRDAIYENGIEVYPLLVYPANLDHYFRHLYRIVKFVDETKLIDEEDKYEYIGIVRATLSRYELLWLFYNCLSKDKFKRLIERYALLKNLRTALLVDEEHETLYEKGAYEYAN